MLIHPIGGYMVFINLTNMCSTPPKVSSAFPPPFLRRLSPCPPYPPRPCRDVRAPLCRADARLDRLARSARTSEAGAAHPRRQLQHALGRAAARHSAAETWD